MKKIVFLTYYDMICYGTRLLSAIVNNCGLESHLILFKKETSYVPIFKRTDKYQTYQYYYNGLLRGSHYAVDRITDQEVRLMLDTIEDISPSLICLSTRSFAYELSKEVFQKIRQKFPKVPILSGGWGPTLEPEKFLEFSDYVCFGEGEETIKHVCFSLKDGISFADAPNLIYYKEGRLVRNPVVPAITKEKLNEIPFPDFELKNKYLISANKIFLGKEFYNNKVYDCFCARGCPLNCTYCLSGKYTKIYKEFSGKICPKYRLRDLDKVFEELHLAKERGAEFIRFKDEVFPIHQSWIKEFLRRYPKEINLPFFGFLRPEFHNQETIRMLRDAGLAVTMVGIQSGAKEVRKDIYKRKLPKRKVIEFSKTLDDLGIQFSYHFIYRNPFEKEDHLKESLEFTYKLPPRNVFIFKLEFFPGSTLSKMVYEKKPVPIPTNIADWYAILHSMSLKGKIYKKMTKIIHRLNLLKQFPYMLSFFFIPSLVKEFFDVLKNRYFLRASLHFSHKTK